MHRDCFHNYMHVQCREQRVLTWKDHYNDVIMGAIASQITGLTIVYSIVYSDADQRKHQSSASLAFVRGFHRGPVNSPHKWPVARKMFSFYDVILQWSMHYLKQRLGIHFRFHAIWLLVLLIYMWASYAAQENLSLYSTCLGLIWGTR